MKNGVNNKEITTFLMMNILNLDKPKVTSRFSIG